MPDGQDPAGDCTAMDASTCGTTGSCDGAGQCATYPAGTPCGATTCASSMLTVMTCSAAGQCTQQVTNCTPYACDGSSACKDSCADPADCAPSFLCTAPTCAM